MIEISSIGMIIINELATTITIAEMLSDKCFDSLRCKGYNKYAINAEMQIVPKNGWKKRKATTTDTKPIIVQLGCDCLMVDLILLMVK
jgi:hypothetical protein